jgi:hypothetical protein
MTYLQLRHANLSGRGLGPGFLISKSESKDLLADDLQSRTR